jgi:NodT family efflux transporter outer membrane factor (OMF) lipoprotein
LKEIGMSRHRIRSATLMGASALLLAGCVVGPRFSPPVADAPAAWAAARPAVTPGGAASLVTSAEPAAADWWTSFGDAELSSLIDRALASNLNARQAVLRIEEARTQRRIVAAGAFPQVNATSSYQNTRLSERTATGSLLGALGGAKGSGGAPGGTTGAIPGLSNPFDQYQYGLTGSWELDLFGRVKRSVEAANADAQAMIEDRRAVQVALMAEVAAAYIDLRSVQARAAVAKQNLETAQGLLRLAADARAGGLGNDLDVAGARGAVATAQAQLPPLQAQAVVDRNQLTMLLDQKPGALDPELETAEATPPLPLSVPVGLPADLARRRPDIRKAEAQLHGYVAREGVAVANLYPRVTLNAAAGIEASDPASLTDWAARYMTIGPALDLPIFDAGQRRANVHVADLRAREAALAYAQTVLAALHEAENAITAYGLEQARRSSLQIATDETRAALELARRRYKAGSVGFRDVLDAESRLEQADLALTVSTGATAEDLVGLYKALGGGWEAAEPRG